LISLYLNVYASQTRRVRKKQFYAANGILWETKSKPDKLNIIKEY